MTIQIYNTLKKKKELFQPIKKDQVSMYVCGPTVYDSCHIGHARSIVTFDVISRYFKEKGFKVTYVRNFTDIDDKIINRAHKLGIDFKKLTEKYIDEFYEDMDALNVERPTIEPKATEHITHIIKLIEKLIDKNLAYQIEGDIFFAIESFKNYGKLSWRKLKDMEAGARVNIDKRKHNLFDFALWKSAKHGEPSWHSPWGRGRPGWHIECSAMSTEYLGKTFDIHGGGKDLIFPHHENEIAQSEGAFDQPFARFWIHNGFVNINQEKMSKSLGNFLTIKNILKSYHPETVRLFFLSSHYRSPIDFTEQAIDEVSVGLDKIYATLERVEAKKEFLEINNIEHGSYYKQFCKAMDDDFNTALGIGVLFNAIRNINRLIDATKKKLSQDTIKDIVTCKSDILKIGGILGILYVSPRSYFEEKQSKSLGKHSINPTIIETMINDREKARKAKDWKKADTIRNKLAQMNITIEDHPKGTIWKFKK